MTRPRSSLDRDVDNARYASTQARRSTPWIPIAILLAIVAGIAWQAVRIDRLNHQIEAQENVIRSLTMEIYYGGK